MPTPSTSAIAAGITGDALVDVMTTGYRWNLNADRTVDWSISNGFNGEFWTDPTSVQQHVSDALGFISYYANIKFNYLGFYTTPAVANVAGSEIDVTMDGANQFFTSTLQWARGFFPQTSLNTIDYSGAPGDVYLNIQSAANSLASYEPGSIGWTLILHELGHALGLKHPHDDGGTGHPTFSQAGIAGLDQDWLTVMSYSDDYDWNQLTWHPATPMLFDVLALQYLYGPNMATNAGDSLFNLTQNNLYGTIWDASGVDTVSISSVATAWTVYLPNNQVSALVPTLAGYAVPSSELSLSSPHSLYWLTGNMENLIGSSFGDDLHGNNLGNQILAGAGNDTITAGNGTNYLRGEDGNDSVVGGSGFDDINGNKGDDAIDGGFGGGDWLVGGQGNDLITAHASGNILYGNLGNDTLNGGTGAEILRGGQGDDIIAAGAGNDWISGDRGNDTVTGGAGADIFHTFNGAGIDRVLDFSVSQGDQVQLDPGTTYTVAQVGADTVIDLGAGEKMVLVGVQLSTLPTGWIFGS